MAADRHRSELNQASSRLPRKNSLSQEVGKGKGAELEARSAPCHRCCCCCSRRRRRSWSVRNEASSIRRSSRRGCQLLANLVESLTLASSLASAAKYSPATSQNAQVDGIFKSASARAGENLPTMAISICCELHDCAPVRESRSGTAPSYSWQGHSEWRESSRRAAGQVSVSPSMALS